MSRGSFQQAPNSRGSYCLYSLVALHVLSGGWCGAQTLIGLAPAHPPQVSYVSIYRSCSRSPTSVTSLKGYEPCLTLLSSISRSGHFILSSSPAIHSIIPPPVCTQCRRTSRIFLPLEKTITWNGHEKSLHTSVSTVSSTLLRKRNAVRLVTQRPKKAGTSAKCGPPVLLK